MRPLPILAATLAIAAMPAAVLGGLMLSGEAATLPGLTGIGLVLLAAFGLALGWAADLARLAQALQRGTSLSPPRPGPGPTPAPTLAPTPAPTLAPTLGPHVALMRAVQAEQRREAERGRSLERKLSAERAMVERLPDPLVLLDADRGIRRANVAARTAYGGDLAAVLRHPDLRGALDRVRAGSAAERASLSLPVPVPREVEATVIRLDTAALPPEPDARGATRPARTLVVLSDRSRERAVERMRADFVANASHELRTPLASLIGFIETLQGPAADDGPAQARFLAIMAEQAARMNRLIDDLLNLSRIELTEHLPPTGTVALEALTARLLAAFEPRLLAAGMRLEHACADALPPVPGDADQVAQVLQNLFDNAVKYGQEGGVMRVGLGLAHGEAPWPAGEGVVLSVSDDGPGIAPADLPRLTERFYRADRRRSRAIGGHRARTRHRQAHRQPASRAAEHRERGGAGDDGAGVAAAQELKTRKARALPWTRQGAGPPGPP